MAKNTVNEDGLSEYMELKDELGSEDLSFTEASYEMVRLNGLMEVLGSLGYDGSIMMDGEGIPYIDAQIGDNDIRFIYIMAGTDTEEFFLEMSTPLVTFDEEEEVDFEKALLCENFNQGSIFGYAVYHPLDGEIELRAQTYEEGGLSSSDAYRRLIDHFLNAQSEFYELMEEQEN